MSGSRAQMGTEKDHYQGFVRYLSQENARHFPLDLLRGLVRGLTASNDT